MRFDRLRAAFLAVVFLLAGGLPALAHRGAWLAQQLQLEKEQRAAREEAATAQLGAALRVSLVAESSRLPPASPAAFWLFGGDHRRDAEDLLADVAVERQAGELWWSPALPRRCTARNALPADDDSDTAPERFRLAWSSKTRYRAINLVRGLQHHANQQFSCEIASDLFQGAWTDPVTGMAYHRARWYDARTASWLSEDPAGTVDSSNLYAYVGWGPQGATDPFGRCAVCGFVSKWTRFFQGDEEIQAGVEADARELGANIAAALAKEAAATATEEFTPAGPINGLSGAIAGYDFVREEPVDGLLARSLSGLAALPIVPGIIRKLPAGLGVVAKEVGHVSEEVSGLSRAEARAAARRARIAVNSAEGGARELRTFKQLLESNPGASVYRERYLRDSAGRRVLDPLTGEARRVDFVVSTEGKVIDVVEVTSATADKAAQVAKERRIREAGGVFVRDPKTRQLLSIEEVSTRLVRAE